MTRSAPPDVLDERAALLRVALRSEQLDALLVTSLANIAYLTGFFASAAALVVTPDTLVLVGDGRYADELEQRRRDYPAIDAVLLPRGDSYDPAIADRIAMCRACASASKPRTSA